MSETHPSPRSAAASVPGTAAPRIANAPVSYGVFGHVSGDDAGRSPAEVLRTMRSVGYEGSELGPPGFFGSPEQTRDLFAETGLSIAGAYVPLHTVGPEDVLNLDLKRMRITLDELVTARCSSGPAILADEGSPELLSNPVHARSLALSDEQWRTSACIIQDAADLARDRGLEVSFHPHVSTYVEQPWEVERLLELTDVPLTFDVGHVVFAGGDALKHLDAWWERINHIHVKDGDLTVLRQALESKRTDFDNWWANLCTPLGEGDLDLENFLAEVLRRNYTGWLVVEQDRAPARSDEFSGVARDQAHNFDWLSSRIRAWGTGASSIPNGVAPATPVSSNTGNPVSAEKFE
ncbi:sugar phosphate isomerase/epimerase [Lysinibacter sp. HNR]|uniref:sugar phosphate isomerase/epimerase family protein n=1 Tax=Lysinibacter sp. HNR TaxID=3031408 RepID=UPI002435C717|nr:sugar phosphate isomerase/epimerase [Lysinibacter sp. HNR]WGD37514.1 sugar phosphate isomerase/epimerase [Lysinibacter sp. HNR]